MATTAFVLTATCYAVACVLFSVHLIRGSATSVSWATRALGAGAAVDLVFVGVQQLATDTQPLAIRQALAILSLLVAAGYLLVMRRRRMSVLGAFIAPLALLLLLGAGLGSSVPAVPPHVRSALLPLHIGVNVLGIVAFALAFAAAVGYLVQERLLRRKQVIGLFQRLPALDVLDAVGLRLVTLGFPLFTIGVVTGSLWAVQRSGSTGVHLSAAQGFALVAWTCFAAVLIARAAAGWRGRRAAIGTLLGFGCAMAALIGYLARGAGVG
jgi:ABC-type uncharacterized transport system permease subunit